MFQEFYGFTRTPFAKTTPTLRAGASVETDKLFAAAGQKELAARLTRLRRAA